MSRPSARFEPHHPCVYFRHRWELIAMPCSSSPRIGFVRWRRIEHFIDTALIDRKNPVRGTPRPLRRSPDVSQHLFSSSQSADDKNASWPIRRSGALSYKITSCQPIARMFPQRYTLILHTEVNRARIFNLPGNIFYKQRNCALGNQTRCRAIPWCI